jgi:hypothetical protein
LNFDSNTFVIDATNNRVGVGTASPAENIEIAESAAGVVGPVLYLHNTVDNASTGHGAEIRFNLRAAEATARNAAIRAVAESGFGTNPALTFLTSSGSTGEPTERMRITSAGNVGIGTSSPADSSSKLTVSGVSTTLLDASGSLLRFNKSAGTDTAWVSNRSYGWHNGNGLAISTQTADDLKFGTNSTERMRIDSSGRLLVGLGSSVNAGGKLQVSDGVLVTYFTGNDIVFGRNATSYIENAAGTSSTIAVVSNTNGVILNNGATSWSSFSDARLKDVIEPISNALAKVAYINPVIGKYKTDSDGTRRSFLIAQDVQQALPEAVSEQVNEKADGETYLTVSYTDVIPLLVAAIQEQQAIINDLKARIETLESK